MKLQACRNCTSFLYISLNYHQSHEHWCAGGSMHRARKNILIHTCNEGKLVNDTTCKTCNLCIYAYIVLRAYIFVLLYTQIKFFVFYPVIFVVWQNKHVASDVVDRVPAWECQCLLPCISYLAPSPYPLKCDQWSYFSCLRSTYKASPVDV